MDELVERLSNPQSVEVSGRPAPSLEAFKERIEMNYVLIRFVETGTELGVKLDPSSTVLKSADLARGVGTVKLRGTLNLNYTDVTLEADIDLRTLAGIGRLEVIEKG